MEDLSNKIREFNVFLIFESINEFNTHKTAHKITYSITNSPTSKCTMCKSSSHR